ncbi:MAG: hypothetical protein KAS32_07670 [Candidatus Peribacteraceae bacterium]|nr:hypothetical protein [Candidatus Peribacteraceae bacterium]
MQAAQIKEKCVLCNKEKKIYCQKRRMCKLCYLKWYRQKEKVVVKQNYQDKIFHLKEVEFIKNFFTHQNWVYQPANFRVNGHRYCPDFYDGERNVFIEVAGTYQAFYGNRSKYRQFIQLYPKIKFEVRVVTGKIVPLSTTEGTFPYDEIK